MKPWAGEFYNTTAWHKCRELVMKRDQYLCQDCLQHGIYTAAEEVHHIIPLTERNVTDADVTLNLNNLVALCHKCHGARHGGHQRRYRVDKSGRVEILDCPHGHGRTVTH